MRLISLDFNKVSAERTAVSVDKLEISTGINITSINNIKPKGYKGKDEILEVIFIYKIIYKDLANIELAGKILLSIEPKSSKEILKQWEDKAMTPEFQTSLFNLIIKKASVRALQFEEELKLPYHIPFPSVKTGKKE